jgi:hypothetical protein
MPEPACRASLRLAHAPLSLRACRETSAGGNLGGVEGELIKITLTLVLLSILAVQLQAEDFTLRDGRTITNATVLRSDAASVTLKLDGGIERVEISQMPENVQRRFNYDPAKAAALRQQEATALAKKSTTDALRLQFQRDSQSKLIIHGKLIDRASVTVKHLHVFVRAVGIKEPLDIDGSTSIGCTVKLGEKKLAVFGVPTPTNPNTRTAAAEYWAATGDEVFLRDFVPAVQVGAQLEVDCVEDNPVLSGIRSFLVIQPFTFEEWKKAHG